MKTSYVIKINKVSVHYFHKEIAAKDKSTGKENRRF
jgi:hypothetical protein